MQHVPVVTGPLAASLHGHLLPPCPIWDSWCFRHHSSFLLAAPLDGRLFQNQFLKCSNYFPVTKILEMLGRLGGAVIGRLPSAQGVILAFWD